MDVKSAQKTKKIDGLKIGELYSKYGMYVILLIMVVIGACVSKNFLTQRNITNIFDQNAYLLVMAFGTTFVFIIGCINIAYDKIMTLAGCCAALIFAATQSVFVMVVGTIIIGIVIGYIYGGLVTWFKLPPFIVGLAVSSICEGLVLIVTNGQTVSGLIGTAFCFIGQEDIGPIPASIVIMLGFMLVTWFILRQTTFGRKAIATGGNKKAAIVAGIRADRVIRIVYLIDGITATFAGLMFMSRLGAGQTAPGTGYGFDAITGVVIGGASLNGGAGGVLGSFVGIMIVAVMNNVMNLLHVASPTQMIFKGLLIVIAFVVDMKSKEAVVKAGMRK